MRIGDQSHENTHTDNSLNHELIQKPLKQYAINYSIAYNQKSWPEISYWGTPTIYLFEGNKVLAQIVGWPKDNSRSKNLLDALIEYNFINQ